MAKSSDQGTQEEDKRRKLKTRLTRYSDWVKEMEKADQSGFEARAIKLPPPGMPSVRELTPREKFAILRDYTEKRKSPKDILTKLSRIPWKGFTDSKTSFYKLVDRVMGMSNDEIAEFLSSNGELKKGTTLRQRLVDVLDTSPGPDGFLGPCTHWHTWLDEELRFWVLEGYPPPRIALKIWPKEIDSPGLGDAEVPWRKFMKGLNAALRKARKGKGTTHVDEYLPRTATGNIGPWLSSIASLAGEKGAQISKEALPHKGKIDVDVRTVQEALKEQGFVWKTAGRLNGFGKWIDDSHRSKTISTGAVPPKPPKF